MKRRILVAILILILLAFLALPILALGKSGHKSFALQQSPSNATLMKANTAVAAAHLLPIQVWAINEAMWAAAPDDNSWTLAAIIMQESSGCADKHDLDPDSYGCGQLTLMTAHLFDHSVTAEELMRDDRRNIAISAAYLASCKQRTHSWSGMLRCYHGRKDWRQYVKAVRGRLQWLKRIRADHG